jgi:hypothetical protein
MVALLLAFEVKKQQRLPGLKIIIENDSIILQYESIQKVINAK